MILMIALMALCEFITEENMSYAYQKIPKESRNTLLLYPEIIALNQLARRNYKVEAGTQLVIPFYFKRELAEESSLDSHYQVVVSIQKNRSSDKLDTICYVNDIYVSQDLELALKTAFEDSFIISVNIPEFKNLFSWIISFALSIDNRSKVLNYIHDAIDYYFEYLEPCFNPDFSKDKMFISGNEPLPSLSFLKWYYYRTGAARYAYIPLTNDLIDARYPRNQPEWDYKTFPLIFRIEISNILSEKTFATVVVSSFKKIDVLFVGGDNSGYQNSMIDSYLNDFSYSFRVRNMLKLDFGKVSITKSKILYSGSESSFKGSLLYLYFISELQNYRLESLLIEMQSTSIQQIDAFYKSLIESLNVDPNIRMFSGVPRKSGIDDVCESTTDSGCNRETYSQSIIAEAEQIRRLRDRDTDFCLMEKNIAEFKDLSKLVDSCVLDSFAKMYSAKTDSGQRLGQVSSVFFGTALSGQTTPQHFQSNIDAILLAYDDWDGESFPFVIPMFLENNHWVTVVAVKHSDAVTVYYIDFYYGPATNKLKTSIERFFHYKLQNFKINFESLSLNAQKDGVSCGVFVLAVMDIMTRNLEFDSKWNKISNLSQRDIYKLRPEYAEELKEYSNSKNDVKEKS
eukprot:NODE_253_length_12805_cov_0.273413.p2 type:complete len:626 gc:universal NODE_253_length_12805_cov_0.273413:9973-8096(-)